MGLDDKGLVGSCHGEALGFISAIFLAIADVCMDDLVDYAM